LPNDLENGIAHSIPAATSWQAYWLRVQSADQGSSFFGAEGAEVRTSMILPPNLYRNMNETRILKNSGARHAV
jgi:hypothetical protein